MWETLAVMARMGPTAIKIQKIWSRVARSKTNELQEYQTKRRGAATFKKVAKQEVKESVKDTVDQATDTDQVLPYARVQKTQTLLNTW